MALEVSANAARLRLSRARRRMRSMIGSGHPPLDWAMEAELA